MSFGAVASHFKILLKISSLISLLVLIFFVICEKLEVDHLKLRVCVYHIHGMHCLLVAVTREVGKENMGGNKRAC